MSADRDIYVRSLGIDPRVPALADSPEIVSNPDFLVQLSLRERNHWAGELKRLVHDGIEPIASEVKRVYGGFRHEYMAHVGEDVGNWSQDLDGKQNTIWTSFATTACSKYRDGVEGNRIDLLGNETILLTQVSFVYASLLNGGTPKEFLESSSRMDSESPGYQVKLEPASASASPSPNAAFPSFLTPNLSSFHTAAFPKWS